MRMTEQPFEPNVGDHVTANGQNGVFEVTEVDPDRRTAKLRLLGDPPLNPPYTGGGYDFPWGVLSKIG